MVLRTRAGTNLAILQLSTAHCFSQPVLSVGEVTQANQCAVVLRPQGGCIARQIRIDPKDVITPLKTSPTAYALDLVSVKVHMSAREARQARITDLFRLTNHGAKLLVPLSHIHQFNNCTRPTHRHSGVMLRAYAMHVRTVAHIAWVQ